jgi:glycosyltransferase involved in cell wall biosynthesis
VDTAKAELTDEITDQVVFVGFVPNEEIPAFYRLADVFVSPSFEEGSSISVTEAIASQTPVVGSRIDGIRQQIDDGVHGQLVEPGDTDALADALTGLLSDPETRAEMTAALGERAVELSWPRVTERTVDVYAEVLR